MLHNRAQTPQKRERDAATDTEQPEGPQKVAKLSMDADAATGTNSKFISQTPNKTEGRARLDSVTLPLDPPLEGFETIGSEEIVPPEVGVNGKGKATVTDHDQHGDQRDTRTENVINPGPQANVPSFWSSSSDDPANLQERIGDLFAAPDDVVLVHACNTQGSWGAGIAKEFRKRYPMAFDLYQEHCLITHHPKNDPVPTGSCLLIPPSEERSGARRHWIACLFTSAKYGGRKDSKGKILANTAPAFRHLLAQLSHHTVGLAIQEVRMCQINSGLFGVEWEHTKLILEAVLADTNDHPPVRVYSLGTAPSKPSAVRKGQTTLRAFIRRH